MRLIDKNVPVLNEAQRHEEAWSSEGITPRNPSRKYIEVTGQLHIPVA